MASKPLFGPFREGAPITWTFYLDDGPLDIENYFLNVEIHEEACTLPDFETSAGISQCCRRTAKPLMDTIIGQHCWIIRHLFLSIASWRSFRHGFH